MKRFKYSFFLVLLLIPNLVFGGMGFGMGGRLGPNSFGIPLSLRDNLAVLIYNHDLTTSTLYDRANQYDFYQGTAAAQGAVTTGPPPYIALDTDEFYPLKEIDDETGITAHQLATVATGARYKATGLDMSQYATESGVRKYRIVLNRKAWAYIGGADAAEAFESELITNGNMELDANWNNRGFEGGETNERSGVQKHAGSYSRHFVVDGQNEGIDSDTFTVTAGKNYTLIAWVYPVGTTTVRVFVYNGNGVLLTTDAGDYNFTGLTAGAWNRITQNYTMTTSGAGAYIGFAASGTGGGEYYIDDVEFKAYTSFGTTAVKLYQNPTGDPQSLTGNTSIDPNAITTMEIYKTIGSDNLTGNQTYGITVKLVDGRPAAAEVLFAHDSGAVGTRSLYAAVETTGKVTLYASEDGTDYEQVQTDDAVFADGAAASFTDLIFVLDKTTGTGAIYVNGSAVATTETITTGTLFDTYRPFEIGAKNGASYLNGDIGSIRVLNTTVTAIQAADQYNADAVQSLINM
uniref:Putative lectin/glucanase superfamily protein n=1 Tax=viral metagenome TaxID=1070528 RepID=A0A6M3IQ63_9ZZZZ